MKSFLYVTYIFLFLDCKTAKAQKLPNVQNEGTRAPSTIKIDGKLTEWNDTFKAYNKINKLFYTLSNDDDNLYLAIKSENGGITSKILYNGITLSIIDPNDKEKKTAISYPVTQKESYFFFISIAKSFVAQSKQAAEANAKSADSARVRLGNKRITQLKDVAVSGLNELPDGLLSIYNEEGITARCAYDSGSLYAYELSIPLKYILSNKGKKFNYKITLNGAHSSRGFVSVNPKAEVDGIDLLFLTTESEFQGSYNIVK